MINVEKFYNCLIKNDIKDFLGVPDSTLKSFIFYLESKNQNLICADEGAALATACGYYLANKTISLVYLQNSGIGNLLNPLISLASSKVYQIPALFLIGFRGEPNTYDEPQHIFQGEITTKLLDTVDVKYDFLDDDFENQIKSALDYMKNTLKPYALIVKKGVFEKIQYENKFNNNKIKLSDAINIITKKIPNDGFIVSTTGYTSRELYNSSFDKEKCFLTVGSMGYANSIALGIALKKPNKKIFCFDGDGALLMHFGNVFTIKSKKISNFKHVVFNNNAHNSTGAQKTASENIDFSKIYDVYYMAETESQLENILDEFINTDKTALLEVKTNLISSENLPRPAESPIENKNKFMESLSK